MAEHAAGNGDLGRRDVPSLRGRLHEHRTRGRTGLAQLNI